MAPESNKPALRLVQDQSDDFDIQRADLDRAFNRAYEEWERVWFLIESSPEYHDDAIWQSLKAHLAQRADNAFDELEDWHNARGAA